MSHKESATCFDHNDMLTVQFLKDITPKDSKSKHVHYTVTTAIKYEG